MYEVRLTRAARKGLAKAPKTVRQLFADLVGDLERDGPIQPGWKNYSKLGPGLYHCHLGFRWVACWRHEKETLIIEVYYAGSRENAPY